MVKKDINFNLIWKTVGEEKIRVFSTKLRQLEREFKQMNRELAEATRAYTKLGPEMRDAVMRAGKPAVDALNDAIFQQKQKLEAAENKMYDFRNLTAHLRVPVGVLKDALIKSGLSVNEYGQLIDATTGKTVRYTDAVQQIIKAHSTYADVMAMNTDLFIALIRQGYKFEGLGAELATVIREWTQGMHRFKMEWLSVLFFGMQMGTVARSLIEPGWKLFHISDLISNTLAYLLVPTMQKDVLPAVLDLQKYIMGLNEGQRRAIGQLIVFGYVTGPIIQYVAMLALTIGALHKALALLPAIVPITIVISVVAVGGWLTFQGMLNAISKGEYGMAFEELQRLAEERKIALRGVTPEEIQYSNALMEGQETLRIYKQSIDESTIALQGAGMTAEEAGLIFAETSNITQNFTSAIQNLTIYQNEANQVVQTANDTFQATTSTLSDTTTAVTDFTDVTNTAKEAIDFVKTNTFDWKGALTLLNEVASDSSTKIGDVSSKTHTASDKITTITEKTDGFKKSLKDLNDTLDTSISKINEYSEALNKIPSEVTTTIKQEVVTTGTIRGGLAEVVKKIVERIFGIHFQYGGIVTRPTIGLLGEAGPEAVIPLHKYPEITSKTININVSPTYNISGVASPDDIREIIEEENAKLIDDLKASLRI